MLPGLPCKLANTQGSGSTSLPTHPPHPIQPNPPFCSSTKGAIVSFTRSLALQLAPKGIRVNGEGGSRVYPHTYGLLTLVYEGGLVTCRQGVHSAEQLLPVVVLPCTTVTLAVQQ